MKIVIDIPEDIYNEIKEGLYDKNLRKMAIAIGNGTPLPKGHGRIGDIDAARKCIEEVADSDDKQWALCMLDWALDKRVIIEADSEVEE